MKTTLLLIRHGESMANAGRYFAGQTDAPLSELGYRQAEATGEYLKAFPIHACYASDLSRAYDTGLAAVKHHSIPVIPSTHLREICCGKWEGLTYDEIQHRYPDIYETWKKDTGFVRIPGGETLAHAQERMQSFLQAVCKAHPGETVCIATHAMVIRLFTLQILDIPLQHMMEHPFPSNASVTTVTWEDGKFTLTEYSHDAHLEGMVTHWVDKA